jgi:hypothetical protein
MSSWTLRITSPGVVLPQACTKVVEPIGERDTTMLSASWGRPTVCASAAALLSVGE